MEQKPNILIVEDETPIRVGLADVFVYHGYQVTQAADGTEGLRLGLSGEHDLILLDVMLPGVNGFEICQRVRQRYPDLAIIMLTAKTNEEEIVQGFQLGADDYVGKPFSVAQLVLRVEAVLRRTRPREPVPERLELSGELLIDVPNLSGTLCGRPIAFTRREMEVLSYLSANQERPVSREELLHRVWGYPPHLEIETRTVDIHIAKLRRKIEPQPKSPRYLVTVRGAGYRLLHPHA